MQCPTCLAEMAETQRVCEACGSDIPSQTQTDASTCLCPPELVSPDIHGICANCDSPVKQPYQNLGAIKLDYATNLALVSDRGRHHAINQDSGIVGRGPSGAMVLVVADGVSSSDKAEVASATAVAAAYREMIKAPDDEQGHEVVRRAVAMAHAAVMAIPHTRVRLEEPETTIVAALVRGHLATIAWVGDSRAYTVGNKYARLITRDDSWLADAIEGGRMTLSEALADRRSHFITQCLGMLRDQIRIHVRTVVLEPDTWLLVCTDGLWNYFDQPSDMTEAVNDAAPDADAFELCQHLVRLANLAGGHDNITAAAYRIRGADIDDGDGNLDATGI
ncbi:MAG TPA: PP2C family serine/threonine-protein phosphatase, partial [Burkholderiaceae bacterium]|nr:PP2C family serine/threonine-protein phosphatase [Burkholderiaceae bacterium]